MKIGGEPYRSIWREGARVLIIDQTLLPHRLEIVELDGLEAAAHAIRAMQVRGAPLIGATAAYGLAVALREGRGLGEAVAALGATRPTAVNLAWALRRVEALVAPLPEAERAAAAMAEADRIADEDVAINAAIGRNGLPLIREAAAAKPAGAPVQIGSAHV